MTRTLEKGREPRTALAARRPEHLHYALTRYQDKGPKLLCVPLESGEEALLVFSFRVSAQNVISSYAFEPECYATGFSAGELISLLVGPCTDIDWVLLDPFPGCLADGNGPANLIHWQNFVDCLLG
jgi:hypothetical protein